MTARQTWLVGDNPPDRHEGSFEVGTTGRRVVFDDTPDGHACEYVRIIDRDANELGYWDQADWEMSPRLAMREILTMARDGVAVTEQPPQPRFELDLFDARKVFIETVKGTFEEVAAKAVEFIRLHGGDGQTGHMAFRPAAPTTHVPPVS